MYLCTQNTIGYRGVFSEQKVIYATRYNILPLTKNIPCRSKIHLSENKPCTQKAIFVKKLMDNKDMYNAKNMIEKE